jgi:hypothetical protein
LRIPWAEAITHQQVMVLEESPHGKHFVRSPPAFLTHRKQWAAIPQAQQTQIGNSSSRCAAHLIHIMRGWKQGE